MNRPTDDQLKKMVKFFESVTLPRIEKQILEQKEAAQNGSKISS